MSEPLGVGEIRALPALVDAPTVARVLGVSTSHVYRLVAADAFPVEALRLGRLLRFRRADVLELVGVLDVRSAS